MGLKMTFSRQINGKYGDLTKIEIPYYGRFYYSPTSNVWYPSVTTVVGYKHKEFFKEWRKKNPENEQLTIRCANRGTKLHNSVELYLNNASNYADGLSYIEKDCFNKLKPYLQNINNIKLQEQSIWSDTLKVAGRVDCISEYKGKLSIIDFKTSIKEKRIEWISNYFQQAAAYSIMYEERENVRIDNIVILISCDDGLVQEFEVPTKKYLKELKNSIDHYYNSEDMNYIKSVIECNIKG